MVKNSLVKVMGMALIAVLVMAGCSQIVTSTPVENAPMVEEGYSPEDGTLAAVLDIDANGEIVGKQIYGGSDYVSISEPATGKYVVTVNLRPSGKTPYSAAMFSIYNDGNPTGYSINIADSRTCNGWGGDAGTQTHDSELQVQDNKLMIFQSDLGGRQSIELPADGDSDPKSTSNFLSSSTNRRIEIDNHRVSWWTGTGTQDPKNFTSVAHENIFALDGQDDAEGPENYTIYAAFNRTAGSAYRTGTGITRVYVYTKYPVATEVPNVSAYIFAGYYGRDNYPDVATIPVTLNPETDAPPAGYDWHEVVDAWKDVYVLVRNDNPLKPEGNRVYYFDGYDTRNRPKMHVDYALGIR